MAAIFIDGYCQVRCKNENRYQCWQAGKQRICDDQLRGRHGRIHGAQPTAKTAPHLCCVIDGQILQQPPSAMQLQLNTHVVGP
jgi:hypothetical protein